MRLLRLGELPSEPGERVFRHSRLGPVVLYLFFVAPLAFALQQHAAVRAALASVPGWAWIVLAPFALLVGGLYLMIVGALLASARRAFGGRNWLARVSPAGLTLHVRSFHNEHFPDDGPTVVRLEWREIACVREVRDVTPPADSRELSGPTRWVELELAAGVDTAALAALVRHERERPAPEATFLGIRSRTRAGHVPVFVPAPGRIHLDWLGSGLLAALGAHVGVGERRSIDRAAAPARDLDGRLVELLRRGDTLGAIELARREEPLSLLAAKERVEELARRAG